MPLQVTNLERDFSFTKNGKKVSLTDPNPALTAAEVLKFYAATHPELTNSYVEGPVVVNDRAVYTMKVNAGKLG